MFFYQASAAPVVFAIDNSQSQILIAAPPSVLAVWAITPQGTGALGTSYSGNINADLSDSTIQFTGGSTINAHTNGVWQPAAGGTVGSAPADYGPENNPPFGSVTLGALRNISFDVTSPALALTDTNFTGTNLVFSFASVSAVLDYYASSSAHGSLALGGYATNTLAMEATLTTNDSTRELVINVGAQFVFTLFSANDTKLELIGQLVATNAIPAAAPFIQSISVTNQSVVVATENTTAQSHLLVSTNLTTWSTASATLTTNGLGMIVFTSTAGGPRAFYRVQQ